MNILEQAISIWKCNNAVKKRVASRGGAIENMQKYNSRLAYYKEAEKILEQEANRCAGLRYEGWTIAISCNGDLPRFKIERCENGRVLALGFAYLDGQLVARSVVNTTKEELAQGKEKAEKIFNEILKIFIDPKIFSKATGMIYKSHKIGGMKEIEREKEDGK